MEGIAIKGYLDIPKEEDRLTIASILFKHGYTVSPKRVKKDGRSNKYLVYYEKQSQDIQEVEGTP